MKKTILEKINKLEKELNSLKELVKKDEKFEECNGLMWSNSIGENLTWKEAKKFAKECRDGGFSDWRLPSISELQSVFDYEKGENKIEGWDAGTFYWSATTYSYNTQNAWYTLQYYGNTVYNNKTLNASVRCVRS